MTRRILTSFVLCLCVLACVAINPAGAAEKKAKEGQINDRVHMIEKDQSTIVVRKAPQRQVIDELKENWYINCQGTVDGVKLVASVCRFRESK